MMNSYTVVLGNQVLPLAEYPNCHELAALFAGLGSQALPSAEYATCHEWAALSAPSVNKASS